MEIAVIHRSITQRRIFRNLLRQTNYGNIRYFETAAACMEEMVPHQLGCVIVQKEILQDENLRPGQDINFQEFVSSMSMLVVSYQFTEEETISLVRNGADALLLMPFAPEDLHEKIAPLASAAV